MSYMNAIGPEEINRRKTIVNNQNLSNDLIVGNKSAKNPRVAADILCDELAVIPEVDSAAYFNEYDLGDIH